MKKARLIFGPCEPVGMAVCISIPEPEVQKEKNLLSYDPRTSIEFQVKKSSFA
jgi:hypothetical protein